MIELLLLSTLSISLYTASQINEGHRVAVDHKVMANTSVCDKMSFTGFGRHYKLKEI